MLGAVSARWQRRCRVSLQCTCVEQSGQALRPGTHGIPITLVTSLGLQDQHHEYHPPPLQVGIIKPSAEDTDRDWFHRACIQYRTEVIGDPGIAFFEIQPVFKLRRLGKVFIHGNGHTPEFLFSDPGQAYTGDEDRQRALSQAGAVFSEEAQLFYLIMVSR